MVEIMRDMQIWDIHLESGLQKDLSVSRESLESAVMPSWIKCYGWFKSIIQPVSPPNGKNKQPKIRSVFRFLA